MDIQGFDLNLLRVLNALLQEGSTVKAGLRIGLSQPAVSAALGRLRYALGDELFLRSGQGLEPTEFARSIARPLREKLEEIEQLLESQKPFDPAHAREVFRLSGSDFFTDLLMPELVAKLRQLAPGIRLQHLGLMPQNNLDMMESLDIDIALIPTPRPKSWVDQQYLMSCPFQVIAKSDNPLLARAGISPGEVIPLETYCALGHVVFSTEGNLKAVGDEALARIGYKRNVVLSLPSFSGVYQAVGGSDLVALLPEQLAMRCAGKAGLEIYQPPMAVDPVELSMVWHKRATGSPAHRWLRELIAEILCS